MSSPRASLSCVFMCAVLFLGTVFCSQNIYAQSQRKGGKETPQQIEIEKALHDGRRYLQKDLHLADSIHHLLKSKYSLAGKSSKLHIQFFIAEVLKLTGDEAAYQSVVKKFIHLNDAELDAEEAHQKYMHLSNYYWMNHDLLRARAAFQKALSLALRLRSFYSISIANCHLAEIYKLAKNKDSALLFTETAIQYARRSGYRRDLAISFNTQAHVFDFFGQLELSVAKNLIAYQLATSVNDFINMSTFARELGLKQLYIYNFKDAENYFSESYEYSSRVNDYRQMALALTYKAEVLRSRHEFAEALKMNDLALERLGKIEDLNTRGAIFNNMGLIYSDLKAYPLAVKHFNKALFLYEKVHNKEQIAVVYVNIAGIFKQQQRYDKALIYIEKSIELRKAFGAENQIFSSFRLLSEVYVALDNPEKALYYLQRFIDFSDQSHTLQAAKKIAELNELYRSEQRDRLISIQADSLEKQMREKELAEAKLENISLKTNLQTYVILAFLIILFLAAIIGFSRYQQRAIQQKVRETEMAQTLLRTQMNPHFIFNAMSVIQSYIYENDVKNSSKFLVNFSRLMRLILENSPKEFISIDTEMDILRKYLETQKLRFEERFNFKLEVADELIFEKAMIPPMITQPFIENAIEHGQLHTVPNGHIRVIFTKNESMLQVSIEDNGVGREEAERSSKGKAHKSMALKITRQRIDNLNLKYRAAGFLKIEDLNKSDKTGTRVIISLPYRSDELELDKKQ